MRRARDQIKRGQPFLNIRLALRGNASSRNQCPAKLLLFEAIVSWDNEDQSPTLPHVSPMA